SLSDTAGNTYSIATYNGTSAYGSKTMWCGAIAYARNIAASANNVVTASWTGDGGGFHNSIIVMEFSGAGLGSPLDKAVLASSSFNPSSPVLSSTFSTASAPETIVGCGGIGASGSNSWTIDTGYTSPAGADTNPDDSVNPTVCWYKTVSTLQTNINT